MVRDTAFAPNEWYHCYSRGVDKRRIFSNRRDYERFQMLLFVSNGTNPIHLSNIGQKDNQGPTLIIDYLSIA